jgi:hypothetical protein
VVTARSIAPREAFAASLEFLCRDCCLPDGSVLSWVSADNPGFAYPEAGGLLLSLLSRRASAPAEPMNAIAAWLASRVSERGGVGRDGADYAFDSAMALAGLRDYRAAGGELRGPSPTPRLRDYVLRSIRSRTAVDRPGPRAHPRWSERFGCHLLKLACALADDPLAEEVTEILVRELFPLYEGGRFRVHEGSTETYLHACGYAAEGLIALADRGSAPAADMLRSTACWLTSVQSAGGGLHAWHDGRRAHGPLRADATAQAVRIWVRVDGRAHRIPIERGLAFLSGLVQPRGGVLYEPGSADTNTWATIFAVQAAEWAALGRASGLPI